MAYKQNYVLGFCFDEEKQKIKLIRKLRPKWQANRLNGIGGKVEANEHYITAMEREFLEETGVKTNKWELFCVLENPEWSVYCFRLFNNEVFNAAKATTDELLEDHLVETILSRTDTISNLHWLIPLARNSRNISLPVRVHYFD